MSVVVCVHNGARDLPNLFAALRRQTLARDRYEVLLVDDASTDATVELAEAEPGVKVVRADGHVGLPRARNIGMAEALAPVLALTDADTTPDPRWLELGLRQFETTDADVLAGGIEVPLGPAPGLVAMLDAVAHFNQEDYVGRGFGAGANLWVRREVIDRVGGFNERLAAYGGDDNEFGQRATSAGAKLRYAPEVLLTHPPRTTVKALARKRYLLGYGLAAHRRYNPGPMGRTPRLFLRRSAVWPPRQVDLDRLGRLGLRPDAVGLRRLKLGSWLLLQLPQVVGDLRGELAFRRSGDGA